MSPLVFLFITIFCSSLFVIAPKAVAVERALHKRQVEAQESTNLSTGLECQTEYKNGKPTGYNCVTASGYEAVKGKSSGSRKATSANQDAAAAHADAAAAAAHADAAAAAAHADTAAAAP